MKIYHSALLHPLKIVGAGLSIMGKFPLVATDEIRYADPGEYQNWPASKGVLMARFNVNGMMLDVYTTHIAAGRSPDSMPHQAYSDGGDLEVRPAHLAAGECRHPAGRLQHAAQPRPRGQGGQQGQPQGGGL